MTNDILASLRHEMQAEGIDAIILPTGDPHDSEYVAAHWQARRYVSGFTGSAGTAVVTLHDATLWTDSRYFIQAAEQLRDTEFLLMKDGLADTPDIVQWLMQKMSAYGGTCIAIDGTVANHGYVVALQKSLGRIGVTVRTNYDAMKMIWKDRPQIPANDIYAVDKEYIGESTCEKLSRIRHAMAERHADAMVTTDLMSIAWTLNLRGDDMPMTPVFISNLYVAAERAVLFCNGTLTPEATSMMKDAGVEVCGYEEFATFLKSRDERIMADSNATNHAVYMSLRSPIDCVSPIIAFKAVKNEKEIEGFRKSMLLDGVAMVRFLRWLKPAVEAGGQTEITASDKLEALRREAREFRDLSFATICGYQEHGAIVHYTATPETGKPLKPEGLVLIDSGAQYTCGTTDITRTIALGKVTDEMRRAYTLVLKANIAIATALFPKGTNGSQLDTLARSILWSGGLNYLHGTGHGVGWRLCVHEGPHSMRLNYCPAPLLEGMTITDEPGVYLEGRFGIRTENTMIVTKHSTTEFGDFMKLEPLTLCPIDTTPIDFTMLTKAERDWLTNYHMRVREQLLPLLNDEEDRQWLIDNTTPILS